MLKASQKSCMISIIYITIIICACAHFWYWYKTVQHQSNHNIRVFHLKILKMIAWPFNRKTTIWHFPKNYTAARNFASFKTGADEWNLTIICWLQISYSQTLNYIGILNIYSRKRSKGPQKENIWILFLKRTIKLLNFF